MPGTQYSFVRRMVAALCPLLLTMATNSLAGPWINPGDETLRHHIQVLGDAGIIGVPLTTWPLMWSGIKNDINQSDFSELTAAQAYSLRYVRFALHRDTDHTLRLTWRGDLREHPHLFTDFADSQRDQSETSLTADWMGSNLTGRIKVSYTDDINNDSNYKLDGSYLGFVWGNWALTAGELERWWGPGWQNSLILGTNARPAPGLSLQRNRSDAFETPWLSWIGPWHLETFMSRLEDDRYVNNALLWGLRITFKPVAALEVGLTRTALWGGDNRPHNSSTFRNLLLGRDNRGDDDIDESNEPGNQLGGIDWRLSSTFFGNTGLGFYGQVIGEDESGGTPSRAIAMVGADASIIDRTWHHRFYLEAADTTVEGFKGDSKARPNSAYEHSIYQSGYRYRNRTIGAATDNDTRILTFAHDLFMGDDRQFSWSISHLELNRDGTDKSPPGGNPISFEERTDLWIADARYSILLSSVQVTVGLDYQSEALRYAGERIDGAMGYFAWEARW